MNKTAFETDSSMRKLLKDGFMTKTVMLRIGVWLVSGSLTLSVQTTRAANIWDGGLGNDGNWNTPANWDNDSVPTFPVALTFAGSIQTANTNNLTGIIVNGFLFDAAAGMFTIDGNAITLGGNIGFTENPSAPITQTINLPMALTGARTLTSEVNGNVLLGGVLSGSGSLLSAGSGTNTLSGNNSFTGGITLNSGTLKATTSANALGAGASTLRLNGGTLHLANDAGLSYNRNTVVSNDVTIVPDRLAAAGTGTTHTLGTLSISNQTLSVAKGPNITGTSVGQVTFGATTLTGDPVFSLAGYSQVQLGNVTESGIPRKLTVKGSGSNPIMILNGTGLWTGGTEMHVGSFLRGNVANSLGASGSMVTVHGGTLDIRANTAGTGRDVQVLSNATVNMRFAVDTTSDFRALSLAADKTLTLSVDRSGTTATSKKLTLNSPFTMLGAGTISVIGGNTFEALLNSGITLGGTLTINPTSAPLTISGVIDDGANTYGIVKTGTGLLTLSGANKYKGGTTVSAGRLLIGSQAAATNAGAVTVNGGIYDLGGLAGVTNGAVTMTSGAISNGTLSATSYSISGGLCYANLAGPGGLVFNGTLLSLLGNNTYSGGTAINGGIFVIPTTAQLPGWNTLGGFSVANGAGLAVGNAVTDDNVVTLLANGTFAAGAGFGFDTTLANRSYPSVIADTGAGALGLIKLGPNTLTLSSGITYSGGTAILGGTLSVPSDSALGGAGGGLIISNNAAFQFSGDMTLNNRPVVVRSSGQIIGDAGKSLTLTNDLTVASGSLTVTGACSVALGGNNVFLNSTWLQGGSLTFMPTSSNVFNTAELRIGHNPGSTGRVTQVGGYVAFNGANNGLLLGNLGGEGTYTLDGGGILRALPSSANRGLMLGVNHFSTGTFYMVSGVLTGTVFQISRSDSGGTNSAGYYYQSGGTAGFNSLSMAGSSANSANNYALLSVSNGTFYAAAFSGLAAGNSSTGRVYIGNGAIGTLGAFPTARGANAYAELLFDGGTLIPSVASTTYMSGLSKAFITDLGATFNVPGGRNITVAQVLEDKPGATGDLTKAGTGVLTLTGANLYTGNTAINDGVLSIPNTGALPGWNVAGRYTVASGAALAFGNVYLDSDIATILATGNYLAGSSLGFDTTAGNRTYSSVLTDWPGGAMGLVKLGANTLTLDNANTYTGWTIVHGNNGTGLVLANPVGPAIQGGLQLGAVGDASGNVYLKTLFPNQFGPNSVLFLNKGTGVNSTPVFELLGNNQVVAGLSNAGTTYIENTQAETGYGGSILTVSNSVDNSYNSVIRNMSTGGSGTLGLTKDGPAALTLSGASITYTGPTLVKSGTLILTNTTALGSAVTIQGGQLLLASPTAMNNKSVTNLVSDGLGFLATNVFTIGGLNGSGNFALTNDAGAGVALTITNNNPNDACSGTLSGSGSLVKLGIGDQALSGASTFSGGVVLGNGTTSNISTSSVATANSGGFVTVGHNQALGTGTLTMKGTQLRASVGGIALANDIDCTVTGGFRFGGSQDLECSGNVIVDGVRGFGNYSLNRTLTLSGASISVTAGSALNFEGSDGAAANGTTVVTGSITGEGAVSVYGNYDNGTVILSGSNSFSGGMTLSTGTLNIGHPAALGTGTFTIGAGKFNNTSGGAMTLAGNIPQTWNGDFTFIGTDDLDLGTGNVTLSAQRYVTVAGGTLTVGGVIDGSSSFGLIKQGNGTMVLSGANTYGGTTYPRAGTLKLGANNTLPNNPVIFQNRTGWTMATIDLNGKSDTIGTLTLSEASSGANQGGAGAQTRIIDSVGGGLLTLGGDVTYNAGPAGEEHGQASISANLDLGGAVRTFTINDSPTATVDTVISGVISGVGAGLIKAGAGVMQLEGVNTYSGDTTISAGTLSLSGSGSITPSANISVASGATLDVTGLSSTFVVDSAQTLKGFGTVDGNLAVAGGVQPGNAFAIGTLAMNGNVTFQAGSSATFDLGSLTGVGGNTNDLLDITGDLNADGTIRINVTEPLNTSGSYCLIKYTGSRSGTFAVTVNGRYTATLNYTTPGQVNVSFTTTATKALTWKGTAGYTAWDQGVSTNWIDGATMTEFLALDNVTFDGTADDNSAQLTVPLFPSSLTVSGSSDITLSGSGSIGGSTGLAKSGAGTLTLATVNDFTGATTLSGGKVRLGSATALGASSSLTLSGGAALSGSDSVSARTLAMPYTLASDVTLGDATDSAALTLSGTNTLTGSRTITTPGTTAVTMSGVVVESGGSFGITKAGSGTLTLNKANTFSGNSTVEAGMLDLGCPTTGSSMNSPLLTIKSGATAKISGTGSALGDTTDVAIEAGGFLDSTKNDTFGGLSGAGTVRNTSTAYTLQVNNGNETTEFSGTITNTGSPLSLQKNGTGTLTLSGVSTYAATTVIDGTLKKAGADALPSGTPLTLGATTTAGKLDLTTFSQTIGSLNVNSTSSAVTNRIVVAAGQTLSVNGNVTIGINTVSSRTKLNVVGGGNMQIVNNGGTVKMGMVTGTNNGGQSLWDLSDLNSFFVDLGAGSLTVGANGDNTAAYPSILTLAPSNTLNAATVTVGASSLGSFHEIRLGPIANSVFASAVNIGIGSRDYGRISFAGNNGAVTLRGLGGIGRANVTMGVSATSSTGYVATNVFDVAGHESDLLIGTLAMGNYPLRVGAWRTYFSFDQGVLDVSDVVMSSGCKAGTSGITTLNLGGGIANIGSLSLSSSTATGIVNVAGGTVTLGGDIVKQPSGRAMLTLSGGTLDMQSHSIGSASDKVDVVTFTGGRLMNLAGFNGNDPLVKTGIGTLEIAGANTYTGTNRVMAGTLFMNGTFVAESAVMVTNNATLGGIGTITGAVSVASAGTLSPGTNSIGTLTVGTLTLSSNATYVVQLGGTGLANYDRCVVSTGAINIGNSILSVSVAEGFVPQVGDLFTIIRNVPGSAVTGRFTSGTMVKVDGVPGWAEVLYTGGFGQDVVLRYAGRWGTLISVF